MRQEPILLFTLVPARFIICLYDTKMNIKSRKEMVKFRLNFSKKNWTISVSVSFNSVQATWPKNSLASLARHHAQATKHRSPGNKVPLAASFSPTFACVTAIASGFEKIQRNSYEEEHEYPFVMSRNTKLAAALSAFSFFAVPYPKSARIREVKLEYGCLRGAL
jgi:hypothetical protein